MMSTANKILCAAFFIFGICNPSLAQGSKEKSKDSGTPFEQKFVDGTEAKWEFGVRLGCDGGFAQNTSVNAPLPVAWPEQTIEQYEETKSNNIRKISLKHHKRGGAIGDYMAFGIPQLGNGAKAEAIWRYRITRKSTIRPSDTNQFEFAMRMNARLKTYLKSSPYINPRDKQIREIGIKLFEENEDQPPWDQVEAVYSWVRENVRYKFDKQIRTCAEALESGHGDCEELSSLFIAICRSQKIPARAVWVPGHTYPEFYLVDETGKGHWFPCQIAGASHQFGEMLEDRPIIHKGDRFKTPVSQETSRYLKAGLNCEHATGALSMEHIMRKVAEE